MTLAAETNNAKNPPDNSNQQQNTTNTPNVAKNNKMIVTNGSKTSLLMSNDTLRAINANGEQKSGLLTSDGQGSSTANK